MIMLKHKTKGELYCVRVLLDELEVEDITSLNSQKRLQQYEVARQITEDYPDLFIQYQPFFLHDGYIYERSSYGGKCPIFSV